MAKNLSGKVILVTGSCGTVGSELVDQLLNDPAYNVKEVIGIDNNESQLFFQDQKHLSDKRASFHILDIRDVDALKRKFSGVDIVFHCAALKHVVMCERSPEEAVKTNILGVENVIEAARDNDVEKVIFTSSDKAVNPTNVMGTTKLMGERLITAANSNNNNGRTVFASTRFGNVLGSNGSVIPIFHNQIKKGGPVTITDFEMTRFVMSVEQSVKLVIDSSEIALGGEVLITKMPVVNIKDLAIAMINELSPVYGISPELIKIIEIGVKPGEKLYEELMSDEETNRAIDLDGFYSVLPAYRGIYNKIDYEYEGNGAKKVNNPYISADEEKLKISEIQDFIKIHNLLKIPSSSEVQRYWPGDK